MKVIFKSDKMGKIRMALPKHRRPTQKEVGEVLGVKQTTYVRKEVGELPATGEELAKFAEFFKININDLFEYHLEPGEEIESKNGIDKADEAEEDRLRKKINFLEAHIEWCHRAIEALRGEAPPFPNTKSKQGAGG